MSDIIDALIAALEDEIQAVARGRGAESHRVVAGELEEVLGAEEGEDEQLFVYRFRVSGTPDRIRAGVLEIFQGDRVIRVPAEPLSLARGQLRVLVGRHVGSRVPEADLLVSDSGILELTRDRIRERADIVRKAWVIARGPAPVPPERVKGYCTYDSDDLNRWQWTAVEIGSRSPLSAVHGPAGTGKTRTAAHLVARLVREGRRVLLVAPTNRATDLLLLAALDTLGWSPEAVEGRAARVGPIVLNDLKRRYGDVVCWERRMAMEREGLEKELLRVGEAIRDARLRLLHGVADEHRLLGDLQLLHAEAQRIETRRSSILQETVHDAQVLATTSCRAALNRAYHGRDHLIVDEAGMCTLPHALLLLTASPKVTLFGDPRQLGPVVVSDLPRARAVLGLSLLGNLGRSQPKDVEPSFPKVLLKQQYRMAMGAFVSDFCYDGQLLPPDASPGTGSAPGGLYWLNLRDRLLKPARSRSSGPRERRWECRSQAAEVIDCAVSLLHALPGPRGSVTVITPYRAHANALHLEVQRRGLEGNIETSTIHRVQGQERRVVILSLPDTTSSSMFGFLAARSMDEDGGRLLTVGVSRAKELLVIAGDLTSLAAKAPRAGALDRMLRLLREHGQPLEALTEPSGDGSGTPITKDRTETGSPAAREGDG